MNPSQDVLTQLVDLLPKHVVNVRVGELTMKLSRHMVMLAFKYALENGHPINRTNGEGPLHEWDGWLELETDDQPHYIETKHVKKATAPSR